MYSIIVSPPAEIDIKEIQEYYDNLADGLGERFVLRLSKVFEFLERHPKLYPVIELEIRKVIMQSFPYAIFYSINENKIRYSCCYSHKSKS
ncbi:MAG TPA: type II toxin-antitoxin system RelE/ParE family toxin [Leptospiraceae bacterium]|nr:type II toxin-antitoxin system RelE/ParE family toxin [Leptospiraceae bacterium]HMW06049.1 type II toxin-antitoxin system RelE/ParE family toxin [Leptospiraceae bacterium]HMX33919.1 type II toxin-antitoxin system RelE/ParE family toxin [Leptospiraceae bacterium]HMY31409.1 type II toxin-antitoxin system RelE/ParE family toxin [Leptospiraceae bacterium]HMZ67258.1 type II toxin-antitoxin system RelE/ParE family toxin [Leptospiraceae bacterium]